MTSVQSTFAASGRPAALPRLAIGVFRTVAAISAVICASRFYSYVARSGMLDLQTLPSVGESEKLLFAGPAILGVIVQLAVGLLILGTCGWALALLVHWVAASLRADQEGALTRPAAPSTLARESPDQPQSNKPAKQHLPAAAQLR
jgi:hypothetical protein